MASGTESFVSDIINEHSLIVKSLFSKISILNSLSLFL